MATILEHCKELAAMANPDNWARLMREGKNVEAHHLAARIEERAQRILAIQVEVIAALDDAGRAQWQLAQATTADLNFMYYEDEDRFFSPLLNTDGVRALQDVHRTARETIRNIDFDHDHEGIINNAMTEIALAVHLVLREHGCSAECIDVTRSVMAAHSFGTRVPVMLDNPNLREIPAIREHLEADYSIE